MVLPADLAIAPEPSLAPCKHKGGRTNRSEVPARSKCRNGVASLLVSAYKKCRHPPRRSLSPQITRPEASKRFDLQKNSPAGLCPLDVTFHILIAFNHGGDPTVKLGDVFRSFMPQNPAS